MPTVRKQVIAIFCADIHLSLNAPIWRSAEPDWFAAMKRPLDELNQLEEKYRCPIFCAGDIFDKWNSPPELINFAIENLPEDIICIPGQHDLPLHNYSDIKKSAYWTLVKAGVINNMNFGEEEWREENIPKLALWGFPYGSSVQAINKRNFKRITVAIAHEYKWIKGCNYMGTSKDQNISKIKTTKLGYDIIVYGDNHKGFSSCFTDGTQIFNCGSLMRRNSDQLDYKPQVGLLYDDGTVKPHYLDTSEDKHLDVERKTLGEDSLNMRDFIKELEKLGDTDLDFNDAMNNYLKKNKIKMPITNIILKAMGK
jgi:DNA repair exonuclease SbcCD nuclease subunit